MQDISQKMKKYQKFDVTISCSSDQIDDICTWCAENTADFWVIRRNYKQYGKRFIVFSFNTQEEAAYFKMTWG